MEQVESGITDMESHWEAPNSLGEGNPFAGAELGAKDPSLIREQGMSVESRAARDGLTDIYNFKGAEAKKVFETVLDEAGRDGVSVCFFGLDLDHFKEFNDTHGHQKGDEVLKAMARALNQTFPRRSDLVARNGGEEFVGMLTGISSEEVVWKLQELARNYQAEVALLEQQGENFPKNVAKDLTFSAGVVSVRPLDRIAGEGRRGLIYESLNAMDERADRELYRAKFGVSSPDNRYSHSGRNAVSIEGNFELAQLAEK